MSIREKRTRRIKRNTIPIAKVVDVVHLINMLKRYEMRLDFVTNILERVYTESFRFEMNIEKFFYRLSSLFSYEKENKIQIEDKRSQKEKLDEEIEKLYINYGVSKELIREYIYNKPIIINFMNLKSQNKLSKELEWLASSSNYENTNRILPQTITTKDLYYRLNRIYHEPDKYIDLVKEIIKIKF
jgi:hypothetical protein